MGAPDSSVGGGGGGGDSRCGRGNYEISFKVCIMIHDIPSNGYCCLKMIHSTIYTSRKPI